MLFKDIFFIFLSGHIIADFYTQTRTVAERKERSYLWVLIHGLCYWLTMLILGFLAFSEAIFGYAALLSVLHLLVDTFKYRYMNARKGRLSVTDSRNIFLKDQLVHMICICAVSYLMTVNNITIREPDAVMHFFAIIGVSGKTFLSWLTAILFIHKPSNIFIQKVLTPYKPLPGQKDSKQIISDKNAGRLIGTLERIIMLIFLSLGQYSSIGLVLTAKSIARYDKISKEKDFAEYYLLGTLLSTILVILSSFLLK